MSHLALTWQVADIARPHHESCYVFVFPGESGRTALHRCAGAGQAPEPELLRFAAEALQNAALARRWDEASS